MDCRKRGATKNVTEEKDLYRSIIGISDQVAKGLLLKFQLQLLTDCASVEIIQVTSECS